MIKIRNLYKSYKENEILEDINISISKPGTYVLCGESGCGKSTLINIIGLMENDFEGEYLFFDESVKEMKDKEKELIRFNQIAYIYQNPKFLENESILTNIDLGVGHKYDKKTLNRYLKEFKLNIKLKKKVSTMSGGERKRLSILIALLKDTPLILCDEVTVGLDEENKYRVLDLLFKKSKSKIIIMVTHDISSIEKYTNNIFYINERKIKEISFKGDIEKRKVNKNNKLSFNFLIKHVFNHITSKSGRTVVCCFSMVVALVCLGFCFLLTSSLSESIMDSLGNSINDKQIVLEKKNEEYFLDETIFLSKEDNKLINDNYGHYFNYAGVKYLNDFSRFFIDEEYITLEVENKIFTINNYGVNQINEFTYFNEKEENFIYTYNYDLQEDEVIISLTPNQVYTYSNLLNINYVNERSLMEHFKNNYFTLKMYLKNSSWEYETIINLKVVGYYVSNVPSFFHTNSLWNEHVIEYDLQLPYSYNLNMIDKKPWTVKKMYYFSLIKGKEMKFIEDYLSNEIMNDFRYSIFKKDNEINIYFSYTHDDSLSKSELDNYLSDEVTSYLACSTNGYNVVKEALLQGFSFPTFVSSEYVLLEEYIDYNSYSSSNLGMYQSTILASTNEKLLSLNILDSGKSNYIIVKPYIYQNKEIIGNYPKAYNEIIVSSALANKLNIDTNNELFSEKPVYLLTLKDIEYANGKYKNNFIIEKIFISGIIIDEQAYIYSSSFWPNTFLSIALEKGQNDYLVNNAIYNYEGEDIIKMVDKLNVSNKECLFENPFIEYKKKVDETIYYINLGLSIFSSFCLISSILMMVISSYLFVVDNKREIGIYTFYGYSRKSIEKQYNLFGSILSVYSAFLSSICLILIMYMLNNGTLGLVVKLSSSAVFPFGLIVFISIIVGDVASYFSTRKTLKESPLKQLQEN